MSLYQEIKDSFSDYESDTYSMLISSDGARLFNKEGYAGIGGVEFFELKKGANLREAVRAAFRELEPFIDFCFAFEHNEDVFALTKNDNEDEVMRVWLSMKLIRKQYGPMVYGSGLDEFGDWSAKSDNSEAPTIKTMPRKRKRIIG